MAEQSDTPDTDAEVAANVDEAPNKKSGTIIKVVLFVVGLGIGGTLGFTGYEKVAVMTYSPADDEADKSGEVVEYGEFFEIAGIIINPTQSIGKRYLMLNIGLEGSSDTIADLETKEIVIRDMVIRELGQKTTEQLADVTRRDSMKNDIREKVNKIIREGTVDRLYFTQYVIQ